jgi:hypothetical protein
VRFFPKFLPVSCYSQWLIFLKTLRLEVQSGSLDQTLFVLTKNQIKKVDLSKAFLDKEIKVKRRRRKG